MTSLKLEDVLTEKELTISGKSAPEVKIIGKLKKNRGKVFFGLGAFFGALTQGEGVVKALIDTAKALFTQ